MNLGIKRIFFSNYFVLLIILSLCVRLGCSAFENKSLNVNTYVNFKTIRRAVNHTIIAKTLTANSIAACSYKCASRSSLSLYFAADEKLCHCNSQIDLENGPDNGQAEVTYGVFREATKCRQLSEKDCLALYNHGCDTNGVYTISPTVNGNPIDVWCDMEEGGWTIIQQRQDGSEDFYRGWTDYVSGFGNEKGEYWLGLENIYLLTQEPSSLSISLKAFEEQTPLHAYAIYSNFSISNHSLNYKLAVNGYQGDCGDSMAVHDGMFFSTRDIDNDGRSIDNCATQYMGGWWYRNCYHFNSNGIYITSPVGMNSSGINWEECWGYFPLKEVSMKIRRNRFTLQFNDVTA